MAKEAKMTARGTETSPSFRARIAGLLYLAVIAGGVFAEFYVRGRLIVHGDAAATAHNIVAHALLYRLGFATELFYCACCNVPITLIFYSLFKIVNRNAALLVVFFSLVGTTLESLSLLGHFAPLILLGGEHALSALTTEQLQASAYVSLQLFDYGFGIALVFFAFYDLSLGYLIFRSTFLPRIIGVLLGIEGLCYLANSFAAFLAPAVEARVAGFLELSAVAELFLCLWLLVMGLNDERWNAQASAASADARLGI
jgi:Domain of unknown function (DUF4386)